MSEYTVNDCIELSNKYFNTDNLGYLVSGWITRYADHSPSQNIINSRGDIISHHTVDESFSFEIIFNEQKKIIVDCEKTSYGYDGSAVAYYNGEPYVYDDGEHQSGVGGQVSFHITNLPGQQALAWLMSAGFSVSLVTAQDYNYYSFGITMIPNAYDDGVLYPKTPPIEQISEMEIAFMQIPLMAGMATDTDVGCDAFIHYFEDVVTDQIEYDDGDNTGTGGGGGTYQSRNDMIGIPPLPTLSALDSGFVSLYAPTSSQMHSIATWLWSSGFYDNILKNYSDPFNNILGLWLSPVTPPSVESDFHVGNLNSNVAANKVSANYMERSCGQIQINKFYNSFADYENYRAFKLFLPYYGIVDISTDDVMGGTINVTYHIDLFTGSATIYVLTNRSGIPHVTHQYSTNIYSQIPFSGVNMMSYYNQSISSAANIISNGMSGNVTAMTNGVMGLINAHPTYGGARGLGSTSGFMGIQYPYLIECRSIRDMPKNYNKYNGIPLNQRRQVSELSGYTVFDSIYVAIDHASESERDEINKILKEGVIL